MDAMAIIGVDIVLGSIWLEILGTIGLSLQEQFIRFYENGRKHNIYGINFPPPQIVSSNKMEKMIKRELKQFFTLLCYGTKIGEKNRGFLF